MNKIVLKMNTTYEVLEDYYREALPLIFELKKGELVKLEPTFGGNVRVIRLDNKYMQHHLALVKIKDAKRILKMIPTETTKGNAK